MTANWVGDTVVLRGRSTQEAGEGNGDIIHLINDDGQPNLAYRVKKFIVWPPDDHLAPATVIKGNLSIVDDGDLQFNAGNDNQIAWSNNNKQLMLIDISGIVIRDLWLQAWNGNQVEVEYNYYIELERLYLSDDLALVALSNEVASLS